MRKIGPIVKKAFVFPFVYRWLRNRYASYQLESKTTEEVFTEIYESNTWKGDDSISGTGSDIYQTKKITEQLPILFHDFNIRTMLDIPCGDHNWMKGVNRDNVIYTGADVVKELINENTEKYESEGVHFQQLNLLGDTLIKVDLVFVRDCLVHFSFSDIFLALDNICNSQSKYILTTTFTGKRNNSDIATGQWRPLNLELAPFMFPKPLRIINEDCTEGDGAYEDKALALWKISDIQNSISKHRT